MSSTSTASSERITCPTSDLSTGTSAPTAASSGPDPATTRTNRPSSTISMIAPPSASSSSAAACATWRFSVARSLPLSSADERSRSRSSSRLRRAEATSAFSSDSFWRRAYSRSRLRMSRVTKLDSAADARPRSRCPDAIRPTDSQNSTSVIDTRAPGFTRVPSASHREQRSERRSDGRAAWRGGTGGRVRTAIRIRSRRSVRRGPSREPAPAAGGRQTELACTRSGQ